MMEQYSKVLPYFLLWRQSKNSKVCESDMEMRKSAAKWVNMYKSVKSVKFYYNM